MIGIPDGTQGEVIKAFVQLKLGMRTSPAALREHCAGRLAKYKVPVSVEIRDALHVSQVGRLLRKKLAAQEYPERDSEPARVSSVARAAS